MAEREIKSMKTIGLIGLGNAGRPFGERLLKKGYSLRVYDLNPDAVEGLAKLGAMKTASAKEATAEVTITILPSSDEVRAAVFGDRGVLAGIKPGYILIDLSGTDPNCARELESELSERNAGFLGGTLHASGAPAVTIPKGLLSIVIGGKRETLQLCLEILKDSAQKVICLSEPWTPKSLKLAVIMMAAASNVVTAEVFSWLLAQGIDPRLFLRLLETTESRASAVRVKDFLKRKRSYGGALSNSYKDISQALKVAADHNLALPLMAMVSQLQEMGRAHGLTRIHTPAAIGKLYETLTKVNLSQAVLDEERTFPEPREAEVIYLEKMLENE